MSMMKESEATTAVDDTLEVATDFTGRIPFNMYTTRTYRDFAPLVNLKDAIDSYLAGIFDRDGAVDQYNADFLDNLIFDTVRMAKQDLKEQKVSHDRTIKEFVIRRAGDINSFENRQERLKKDLELAEYDFERFLDLYKRYEFKNGGGNYEE